MATQAVKVPDVGNYKNIPVIELLVKVGETVSKDQALITLESDKATMEVPAPFAGVVTELMVKLGDEVSEGTVVAMIEAADAAAAPSAAKIAVPAAVTPAPAVAAPAAKSAAPVAAAVAVVPAALEIQQVVNHEIDGEISGPRTPPISFDASSVMPDKVAYASPAVRLFARELGVDLDKVKGSGRKERITREDVQAFVKQALAQPKASSGAIRRRSRTQSTAVAASRFQQIRRDRNQTALPHQQDFRCQSGAQLGDDSARHAIRRCRHHRSRSVARFAEQGKRKIRRQGHDARVPDQGMCGRTEEISGLQFVARCER
jgi:pyruvate/2-oxoglutarate dehydrogenase complex dihydrolipoamide acyltransferase (E2) component